MECPYERAHADPCPAGCVEHHRAYLADLPGHREPAQFIPDILTHGGNAAGVEYAVVFRAHSLGSMAASNAD